MGESSVLVLERFCGRETYPVIEGAWSIFHDEELDMPTLCIQLHAGPGIELHEDTETLRAQPSWEINVVSKTLHASGLRPGVTFSVPKGYDEAQGGYVTNFYYCSHQATDDNRVEIVAVDDTTLLVRLSGQTIDVNFYDGSKPPTRLSVEVHLKHDAKLKRSMS
jgi:hypothetical protein